MRVSLALMWLLVPVVALADGPMDQARASLQTMEGNSARVRHMLSEARRYSSPATRCLDGALSRADASVRAGREQARLASAALAAGNTGEAHHQLALLAGQREASRSASHDADACLVPASTGPDETTIRVEVDPKLPADAAVFSK